MLMAMQAGSKNFKQNKPITEKGQTNKVTEMYKMIVEMIYYFSGN